MSFHPELPIILTGSEDCTVRVWHANTYRLENTLNYGLDRVWCICTLKGSNNVCFGYDEGSVMVKVGAGREWKERVSYFVKALKIFRYR